MPPEALTGILHGHKHLGYLLALLPALQLILVLAGAPRKPGLAKIVGGISRKGYRMLGGLVMVLGFVLWYSLGLSLGTVYLWVAILLWGPIEVASSRLVNPQCQTVLDGGQADSRMLAGTLVHLLCLVGIVGLMTVRPF